MYRSTGSNRRSGDSNISQHTSQSIKATTPAIILNPLKATANSYTNFSSKITSCRHAKKKKKSPTRRNLWTLWTRSNTARHPYWELHKSESTEHATLYTQRHNLLIYWNIHKHLHPVPPSYISRNKPSLQFFHVIYSFKSLSVSFLVWSDERREVYWGFVVLREYGWKEGLSSEWRG